LEQYTKRPSGVTVISAVVLYPVNSRGNVVMTYVGVSSPFLSSQPKVVVALSSSLSTQTAGSFGYAQAGAGPRLEDRPRSVRVDRCLHQTEK
jgi:hypothetical protein